MTEAILSKVANPEAIADLPDMLLPFVAAHDNAVQEVSASIDPDKHDKAWKLDLCSVWGVAGDRVDKVVDIARTAQ